MLQVYIENDYLRAGVVFLAVFLVVRLVMFIFSHVAPFFTKKTKTDLDDILLEKISTPFTFLAFFMALDYGLNEINIAESWVWVIDKMLVSFMIIVGAFLVYYLFDSVIVVVYRDFAKRVKKKINESLMQFFHSVAKIVIVVICLLVILSSWGVEIGPLLAGLGVAGIAVAFALQSTLSNVFGGISMLLDKSVNVGDLVELDDGTQGHIDKINLRSTKINTLDNKMIIVPNGKMSESNIKNISLPSPDTRVVVSFGVAYGSDVDKVKKLVAEEVRKVEGFLDKKDAVVRFIEMGESSLNFKAYFYIDNFDGIPAAVDDANTRIYKALNKAGFEIPFPQMDVHLKK